MQRRGRGRTAPVQVFFMDLWATVPYYTAYLSRALLAAGVQVQIGSITYYLDRECFRARGLRLEPGASDVVGGRDLPRTVRRALKLLEGVVNLLALSLRFSVRPPEVVHVQFLPLLRSRLPIDLWFVRFCRWRGARLVITVHDLLPHDTGEAHRAVYARLYARMDALICHSAHIRGRLVEDFGVPAARIAVIPHGPFFYDLPVGDASEAAMRLGVGSEQRVVLWQGIIFPYKGVDLLLTAWQQVEAATSAATLVILGTGDPALLASLAQHVQTLGLRRVRLDFRFCSARELVEAYRAADVVVYPYRAITTSGALATGLALGKAIVASDLPVFREALVEGETALLVNPGDPAELASALLRLLEKPELRERLGRNVATMRFGDQTWAKIAAATAAVYAGVVGRSGADAGGSLCAE